MSRLFNSGTAILAGAFVLTLAGAGSILADSGRVKPVTDTTTKKECGACHMVYPAGLLPARSWRTMMGDLANHFGENAELEAGLTKSIEAHLVSRAGPDKRRGATPTSMRITEQEWWTRKHEKRGRIAPAALAKAGAKSKAECKACHVDAEQGLFDED